MATNIVPLGILPVSVQQGQRARISSLVAGEGVEVKQGRVSIKKTGTLRGWGMDKVAKIPNFLV